MMSSGNIYSLLWITYLKKYNRKLIFIVCKNRMGKMLDTDAKRKNSKNKTCTTLGESLKRSKTNFSGL